jgi:hypothetical protein
MLRIPIIVQRLPGIHRPAQMWRLVLGFQNRSDAERFLEQLRERMRKFGLELHPDKTRLIEFGRYAAARRKKRGEGKPETFNFLGFTHICGRSREQGYFTIYRKTIGCTSRLRIRRSGCARRFGDISNTTPYRTTRRAGRRSATMCSACGCTSFDGGVNAAVGRGSVFWSDSVPPSRRWKSHILGLLRGLPPGIQGKNRVREQRQHLARSTLHAVGNTMPAFFVSLHERG